MYAGAGSAAAMIITVITAVVNCLNLIIFSSFLLGNCPDDVLTTNV
jgi:hypothetical protein